MEETEKNKTSVQDIRQDEKGNWVKGWVPKGGTDFTPFRPATQAEIKKAEGKDSTSRLEYEQDRGKQIDDTRSFYHEMSRHLLDDMGYIKPGPKDDPGKYEREYNDIATKMSKDMNRINKGELPIWYSGKTGKSEKTITQTGTYNGRKVVKYSDGSIKYAD